MSLRIETLAIGDELLTGKISDTNSTFVAQSLFSIGVPLSQTLVIADDVSQIKKSIQARSGSADILVCFGGLGPTTDDLTVDCVSELLETEAVMDEAQKERLENLYQRRGISVSAQALRQVRYPKACTSFENLVGLAPGFFCDFNECRVFFLPGVPAEMEPMVLGPVMEYVKKLLGVSRPMGSCFWRCLGIPESEVQRRMNPVEAKLPSGVWLGYRTSYPEMQVLLYWDQSQSETSILKLRSQIGQLLNDVCYTDFHPSIEATVVELLQKKRLSLAIAESCTGGLAIHRLTTIPGASDWVWGGVASYQIAAKATLLGVKLDTPAQAVTKSCTLQMAKRIKEISGCNVAAAINGYMGPADGTPEDPVGTAYMAVVGVKTLEARQVLLRKERHLCQKAAATHLLNLVRKSL